MVLPESLDCPSRLLQVNIVVILHLLDEFQVLHRDVVVVLPRMREIFFDFLDAIVELYGLLTILQQELYSLYNMVKGQDHYKLLEFTVSQGTTQKLILKIECELLPDVSFGVLNEFAPRY